MLIGDTCSFVGTCAIGHWCIQSYTYVFAVSSLPSAGGIWFYEEDPDGGSACYKSLHTNTAFEMTSFSDFPLVVRCVNLHCLNPHACTASDSCEPIRWQADCVFPHYERVLRYIQDYVDHFDLRKHLQFGREVVSVGKNTDGRDAAALQGCCDALIMSTCPQARSLLWQGFSMTRLEPSRRVIAGPAAPRLILAEVGCIRVYGLCYVEYRRVLRVLCAWFSADNDAVLNGVRVCITENVLVRNSSAHSESSWASSVSSPKDSYVSIRVDRVVVGNGKYNIPKWPQGNMLENLSPEVHLLHSHSFRDPAINNLVNKRVLVIGSSISALEIATELSYSCSSVSICIRRPR